MTAAPTHANIPYGKHARQILDVWLPPRGDGRPTPLYLYFHGGGYSAGDKSSLPPIILEGLLSRGVSVAAANYRFIEPAQRRAPLIDGARALQFVRHHAPNWGIDPTRISAGGSSAGAVTAFYLGLCPDQAVPSAGDPLARQSTRLQCIAAWEAQTTIDPRYIRRLIAGPAWTIASIQNFTGLTLDQYDTPQAQRCFDELHFLRHLGPQSPPVFLYNLTPDLPMTEDLSIGTGIHHPAFGRDLQRLMQPLGVECIHRTLEQVAEPARASAAAQFQADLVEFVARHLTRRVQASPCHA